MTFEEIRPLIIMLALAIATSALVLIVEAKRNRTPIPDAIRRAFEEGDNGNAGN